MLLVQSIKGVTKMTGVVDIEVTQGYFSERDNYNITCFQMGQGSLLFSKFEFSIKPDLRDLSFL